MAKLDGYLRSIEKFGATGAVLTSNQAVMLRFPTGDRHATQVTPHDQLVVMVREVAPPDALDQIDRQRPARFGYESAGTSYTVNVVPRPGSWQVGLEGAAPPITPPPEPARPVAAARGAAPSTGSPPPELLIERGQYDAPAEPVRATASGSPVLDELTRAARQARASDVYLVAGAQPVARVGAELTPIGSALDRDALSREVGVVAPASARAAWSEGGTAVFAYGDGSGRVRATLARDHRGPTATLRLLPEQVSLDRLGLDVGDWLERSGLVVIAGPIGAGKTVTLAALVGALAARRRVISIEHPIEIVQASPHVSQRELGTHVDSVGAAVATALRENVDAIAIADVASPAAALAVIEAVCGGGLVIATIHAPTGSLAIERLVEWSGAGRTDLTRAVLASTLLGTVLPMPSRTGRTFEIHRPGERHA